MRNLYRLMVAAFAVVAATACSQFEEQDALPSGDENLVAMTISVGGEPTRTFISEDGNSLNWCENDKIAIFDGVGKREFTIVEGSIEGGYAEFEGLVDAGATKFFAVYPYEAAGEYDAQAGTVTAAAATAQQLAGENVADGAILSVAQFEKGVESFDFKTAVGYFRVDVTFDDITSIIVKGANIAGSATFNAAGEVQSISEGANQVTLTPAGDTFAKDKSYYVALLPGTSPAGEFSVMLTRAENEALEMTATKAIEIPRNGGFFLADYKLVKKLVIKDTASLQKFLATAHTLAASEEVEVTADIDLQGVELTGATSFAGTLVGNGHSLLNWTSNGVALFETLSGTVKNLKFDSTCSLTPADEVGPFGFLAKTVAAGGVVSYCENHADITFNATKYGAGTDGTTDAVYFGSLVGQSYGVIEHSKNMGDITITSTPTGGDERGFTYIGGVVGLIDNSTNESKTGLFRCENSGDISYSITGRGGYLFMGGVAGGTTANKISEVAHKSDVEYCVNTGNIYHGVGNTLMQNGSDGSNYINMAGIIGYCQGAVANCRNGEQDDTTKGKVQLYAPIYTTQEGYSAAHAVVAGVVGYAYKDVTSCNNYGSIDVDGSFGNNTSGKLGSGNKTGNFFAGVVAQAGDDATSTAKIRECHNYGAIDINVPSTAYDDSDYKSAIYAGGVVAYSYNELNTLSNNATFTVTSQGNTNHFGGVVGYAEKVNITGLTNNAEIQYTVGLGEEVEPGYRLASSQFYGGVLGYSAQSSTYTVQTLINNGNVTIGINGTAYKSYMGGVAGNVGLSTSLTNNKPVIVNDNIAHDRELGIAGVAGKTSSGAASSFTNNGDVTYTGVSEGTLYLGGVLGTSSSSSSTTFYNNNPVSYTNNSEKGISELYIGGIGGYVNNNLTTGDNGAANTTNATITVSATNIGELYAGGVAGYSKNCSTVNNNGAVTINCDNITTQYLGGVAGYIPATITYEDVINNGGITSGAGTTTYLAGIVGYAHGNLTATNCDNNVNIEFNHPELNAKKLYIGGIWGTAGKKSPIKQCNQVGNVTVVAGSAETLYVGGIASASIATSVSNMFNAEDNTVDGNIYVNCPNATCYVGGIAAYGYQWGSGANNPIENNIVNGDITIASATTEHHVGGIIGFTGANTNISGNSYTGAISVGANDASKLSNVGGIVGTLAIKQTSSTTQNATFTLGGNTVDTDITYNATNGYAGLLVGAINNLGTRYTSNLSLVFDINNKVKSSSSINSTEITADNYKNYLLSSYDGSATYASLSITGKDSVVFE